MSSLLTNNSAMVALQTLKTINKNMGEVQNQISTGKRIATARDNAALWGISTTMQTDVSGFKAISESLSLGSATLSVGRDAAETITSLLDQMKGKIVAAQEQNVDRTKIQADIDALRTQIGSVTDAAQFNGLNLLTGDNEVAILSSLNRSVLADGTQDVASDTIRFNRQDLTMTAGSLITESGPVVGATPMTPASVLAQSQSRSFTGTAASAAVADVTTIDAAAPAAAAQQSVDFVLDASVALADGTIAFTLNTVAISVDVDVTTDGDTLTEVAERLRGVIAAAIADDANAANLGGLSVSADTGTLTIVGNGFDDIVIAGLAAGTTGIDGGIADGSTAATAVEAIQFNPGTDPAAGQVYSVTVGETTFTRTAAEGETADVVLEALAQEINDSTANPGVSARVDGDGGVGTEYTLLIANTAADDVDVSSAAADVSEVSYAITVGAETFEATFSFAGERTAEQVATGLRAAITTVIGENDELTGFTVGGTAGAIALNGTGFEEFSSAVGGADVGLTLSGADDAVAATAATAFSFAADIEVVAGQGYQISVAGLTDPAFYRAAADDTVADVAAGLAAAVNTAGEALGITARVSDPAADGDPTLVQVAYNGAVEAGVAVEAASANESNGSGGLFGLRSIDVTAEGGPGDALDAIEGLIQTAIDAAASFGSAQGRIDTQMSFVSKIMDGLTSGIGALVDADMEAASARLQALQVQQQLGIQALSIANQQPQNILALFR